MADKQIIAVVGATGAQGGGLARAILDDAQGPFHVRAVTRNPASEKALALAERGAEVVKADLDDLASLIAAFDGAYGAFCMTNFWEHFSADRELAQAENLAEAAGRVGLRLVIWSTLEDTRKWVPLDDDRMPTLQGRYKVPHLDTKGEAERFFTDRDVPVTFLRTSFYWDNLIHFGMGPQRGTDGVLAIAMPMGDRKLPGIAVEDIGRCAYGIFREGTSTVGKTIGIAGEHLTGDEMARQLSEALEQEVRYRDVPPEIFRGLNFPGADDLGNMFQFKRDFNEDFCAVRDPVRTRSLNPSLQRFGDWLKRHKLRIPIS